ncbi:MAG: zf-TFIIB domain-containing protein [Deltaproteobacteria bacterium]|nr:zf-TFIIB domain-containing protein [Deltaproteobacteria bacterium]
MPDLTPSEKEEEFFARQEFERKKKLEEDKQRKLAEEEKARARELHHMKCPKCGMDLIEIDYREIKVDKCSACSGVWLDAGELDHVTQLEKSGLDRLFRVFSR